MHLVVMGVAGTGKTTIAQRLATRLGFQFGEGDDFHPEANVSKMAAGQPLTDDDRWPWLGLLRDWLTEQDAAGSSTVLTCSALRRRYRDVLREAGGEVFFVHLVADEALTAQRLAGRAGHFMKADMLASQLAALEPLGEDEAGLDVPAVGTPDDLVDWIVAQLVIRFPELLNR